MNASREFSAEYTFDGKRWCTSVWADTFEEAEMKLRAVGKGRIDGVVMEKILASGRCTTCGREPPDWSK